MIEIYLKQNDDNVLRFPVTPSEVALNGNSEISTQKINGLGEVSLFGGKKLKTANINSFFPNKVYSFCNYSDFEAPYEYVKKIESWLSNGDKLRYIVTGMNINIPVIISSFEYLEKDGTGDVYFSLSLIESVPLNVSKTNNSNKTNENSTNRTEENAPSNTSSTHTVVKGDTLWGIAKKYYGDGSKYPQIKEKNKAKYSSLSKNNIIYVGWVLELW